MGAVRIGGAALIAAALSVWALSVAANTDTENIDQPGIEYRVNVASEFHPAEPPNPRPGDAREGFAYRAVPQSFSLAGIARHLDAHALVTMAGLMQSNSMWNVERLDLVLQRSGKQWLKRWVPVAGIGGRTAESMARARVDQLVACAEGRPLCSEPIRATFLKHRNLLQPALGQASVAAFKPTGLTTGSNHNVVTAPSVNVARGGTTVRSEVVNPPEQVQTTKSDPPQTAQGNVVRGTGNGNPCDDLAMASITGSLEMVDGDTKIKVTWSDPTLSAGQSIVGWYAHAWYGPSGPPDVQAYLGASARTWTTPKVRSNGESFGRLRIMGVCNCVVNGETQVRNAPFIYLPY